MGEVADDHLGAQRSERFGTFVFGAEKRADGQVTFAKDLDNVATHSADPTGGTRDQNRNIK